MFKKLALLAALCLPFAMAHGQGLADRPITLIVNVPPGGSSDALARLTATVLGGQLNRSIVVENVTGAGGLVGMQKFLRAPADGSTLLFINQSLVILPYLHPKSAYSPLTDVEPIGVVAKVPMVLSVSNAGGVKSLASLIDTMKKSPGKVNFGSGGPGTTAHLAEALFLKLADVQGEMIQYRGSGPALSDLMAGTIDAVIDQTVTMLPLHKDGRVRAIAVTGGTRLPQHPEIPTFAESGLPGFDLIIWNGVVAPKGTPPELTAKLASALTAAISSPGVQSRLSSLAAQAPADNEKGPAHFRRLIMQDNERVADLAKSGAFASTAGAAGK
ncbi:Bug family tripartite tricarboxylate transporter substrate binding protein [Xylophilus sp. ASV27]|uniref:Bug family tripartite tricarboxylate transporter substrate binding protein n=1 Tax=Xylophilus sp. ASV27 TaxID=2795129 RepID=UPI00351C7863